MSTAPDQSVRDEALDIRRSAIVQAPAGSGKTTLLVERYLKLLSVADQPEEVLAITFTVKAAQEMRERTMQQLLQAAPESINAAAAQVRNRQMGWSLEHNTNRLKIQTIDSFAAGIVRRLGSRGVRASDAGLTTQAEGLYLNAARRTLQRTKGDDPLSGSVIRTLTRFDFEGEPLAQAIASMLASRDQWVRPLAGALQAFAEAPEHLAHQMEERLDLLTTSLVERIQSRLDSEASIALDELRAVLGLEGTPSWPRLARLLTTQKAELRKRFTTRDGFDSKALRALARQVSEDLERCDSAPLIAELRRLPETPLGDQEATQDTALVLWNAVNALAGEFAASGHTDFVELLLNAENALRDTDGPTELALALDYRIRHILVDEFQDTSIAQLRLFELLTEGWHPDSGETFFAVGDPQQSIYRFRDADVARFLRVQREGLGGLPLRPLRLSANFRSSPDVVDWCNAQLAPIIGDRADETGGLVPFSESQAVRTFAGEVVVRPFASAEEEAHRIAHRIRAQVAADPTATIGVLVSNRSHARPVLDAMRACDVAWVGNDLEPLNERLVASDLLAVCRVMAEPQNRDAWWVVLRAPFCGASLELIERLAQAEAFEAALALEAEQAPHIARLLSAVSRARTLIDEVSPREVFEQFLFHSGGFQAYPEHQAQLLEQVLVAIDDMPGDPLDPVQLASTLKTQFSAPGGSAQVEVMTIHKAKGLEFDHVYVLGLDRGSRTDTPPLLRSRNVHDTLFLAPRQTPLHEWLQGLDRQAAQAEQCRLLYVACTRAIRSLHISWAGLDGPSAGTLAHLLTSATEALDEPDEPDEPHEPPPPEALTRDDRLHRIPLDFKWTAPEVPATRVWQEPTDDDDGDSDATRYGTVLHRVLERWHPRRLPSQRELRYALLAAGSDRQTAERDAKLMRAELARLAADEDAAWVLKEHDQAANELALSILTDEQNVENLRLDRTFIADEVRWVVDYKSDRFDVAELDAQIARHRSQLERYRTAARQVWGEPVRIGILFTALPRFVEIA